MEIYTHSRSIRRSRNTAICPLTRIDAACSTRDPPWSISARSPDASCCTSWRNAGVSHPPKLPIPRSGGERPISSDVGWGRGSGIPTPNRRPRAIPAMSLTRRTRRSGGATPPRADRDQASCPWCPCRIPRGTSPPGGRGECRCCCCSLEGTRGGANVHHHPLEQDLLLARDAIIDLPIVEVERTRDEGG